MEYITVALTKGRLAGLSMEMLEKAGFTCDEMKEKSRKLVFVNEDIKMKFFLSKAGDVPTYVEYGAADIGICGKDVLLEESRNLYEVLDLGIGRCRMAVAGPPSLKDSLYDKYDLRVATKYPKIASDFFNNKKHRTIEMIKLNGSVELGPIVSLADVIVDIVETGSTLRENGLVVLDEIVDISARLVVNRVSMKLKHGQISDIIKRLGAVAAK